MKKSRYAVLIAVISCAACESPVTPVRVEQSLMIPRESCYDPDDTQCVNTYPLPDDPNPKAPGYYIGPGYSLDECTQGMYDGDNDADGLDELCEYRLAHAFAPRLSVSPNDLDASREPYWAATYRPGDYYPGIDAHVSIIYLLGYHRDMGSDQCYGCTAHYGDSEFIRMELVYDAESQHWMVWQAFLSAHYGALVTESSELVGFDSLQYPHRYRAYPRVFVAIDKHANYKSVAACDAGAGWTDECPNNVDESSRLDVVESRNLGSHFFKWNTAVSSQSPGYYAGTEYMWDPNSDFCGWFLAVTACSSPYGVVLTGHGF